MLRDVELNKKKQDVYLCCQKGVSAVSPERIQLKSWGKYQTGDQVDLELQREVIKGNNCLKTNWVA